MKKETKTNWPITLLIFFILTLGWFFWSTYSDFQEYKEYEKEAFKLIDECTSAFRKDFPEYADRQIFFSGDASEADIGLKRCQINVCRTEKGWTKENTYKPDTQICHDEGIEKFNFSIPLVL